MNRPATPLRFADYLRSRFGLSLDDYVALDFDHRKRLRRWWRL